MTELNLKDRQFIWHPYTSLATPRENIVVESAKGVYLKTEDGREILDAVSSWWVNIHGHSNKKIAKAIAQQAKTMEHVIFAGFTHKPAIELAERLLETLPTNQDKIFYSDNGSTAVEVGLKLCMQYWYNQKKEKQKIIAIEGAFHGDTFGAMSIGERGLFTKPFHHYLFDVEFIPFPFEGKEELTYEKFNTLVAQGDVAGFIYEPLVQGAAGMRIYSKEILERLIKTAKENNVLCIADEVMTGFGRTGKLFASDHLNQQPDIICLSKGITGGFLPFAATSCSLEVSRAFQSADADKTFFHGHSYTANPIACAAALASLSILKSKECQKNIQKIATLHTAFKEKIASHKKVRSVKTIGTIIAIEIEQGETFYLNSLRDNAYDFFLEKGILLRPLGNIIYIMPPYIIKKPELKKVYKAINSFLNSLL